MARISLARSIKFKLLVRDLGIPEPHVRGYLEYMWETAHEAANPILATPEIVELAAGWVGTPGAFAAALENRGFLDRNEFDRLVIHDYWEHCPDYVRKRKLRQEQARADAYIIEQSGQRQTSADNGSHFPPESAEVLPTRPVPSHPDKTPPEHSAPDNRTPVGQVLSEAAELERRFARYTTSECDDEDKQVLRRVLTYLISERITGKPLPHHRRIKFLDGLVRFPPGVVFIASHDFVDEGHLDAKKDPAYFVAMCERSATSEYLERTNEKRKTNVETKRETRGTTTPTKAPSPIRELTAAIAGRVQRVDEGVRTGDAGSSEERARATVET